MEDASSSRPGDEINPRSGSPRAATPDLAEDGGNQKSTWQSIKSFYEENIGLFFVFLAQIFASIVRLLC